MVARYPGITPEGVDAPSGSANPIGANRVNRNYAVYVDAKGQRYVAPSGKPRSPVDTMVASNLTLQEATEQATSARTKRDLANRAYGSQPQVPVTRLDQGGQVSNAANNTADAVQSVVDSANANQDAMDQGPQPMSAGLGDTWLGGRNQNAIQYVMNGTQVADPRQALNMYLDSQGMDTHANRGFLEQAMANYNPLYQIMNPNTPIDPEYALLGAGNFASGLMGMSGNSMNRVDTRGIYDNIWSDAFRNFNSEQVDQTSGGPQAAYQRIIDSISALAPYMGQQNADYLLTKINTAYEDFLNRSSKGDGMQGEQDFLNFIMQFNPQDWY